MCLQGNSYYTKTAAKYIQLPALFFEKSSPPLYSSDSFYMNRIFIFLKIYIKYDINYSSQLW